MNLHAFERLESEVRSYVRSFPVVFTRAVGATLEDESGRRYIDFFAGAGTLNYGHNNRRLKNALLTYLNSDGIVHGLDMATSAKRAFMETFDEVILQPRGLSYKLQFPGPTGANAVEAALKLARQVKGRNTIISFTRGFHGVTGGALAATANATYRKAAGIALENTVFMPYDGYLGAKADTMAYLDAMLADRGSGVDAPAAVIVETIQGEGGINVARAEWLRALQSMCQRHDMLLIVDDIQMGCGRTGRFFSFEEAGLQPDIVTLSKSLSGYGLPLSLVLIRPDLDIWSPGAHNGTFRGNNLAFVTAREALNAYWRDGVFAAEVGRKGRIVRSRLEHIAACYPSGAFTVRGRGMVQALVSKDPELAGKIAERAFQQGLVIETSGAYGEALKVLAPLVIDEAQLRQGLEIIERSVGDVLGADATAPAAPAFLRMAGAR